MLDTARTLICTRVSRSLKDQVERTSKQLGMTASEYTRIALLEKLQREGNGSE